MNSLRLLIRLVYIKYVVFYIGQTLTCFLTWSGGSQPSALDVNQLHQKFGLQILSLVSRSLLRRIESLPGSRSQFFATKFCMSRLSRPKLGMSRLWRPKPGISRLLRPWWPVATIATEAEVARPKHRDSYLVCLDSRDQELPFPDVRDRN